jgi:histidine triad (HIT) family protein
MADNCLFCKILNGDIPSDEVYSDDEFYAFRDIHPGAPTHILVVPRRHLSGVTEARTEDAVLLGRLILCANKIAEAEGVTDKGFRYVINSGEWGGQSVSHLHLHILGGRILGWPPG